ncbi:unnamed protein product, partial [Discosporangium mesarthrocarpum]
PPPPPPPPPGGRRTAMRVCKNAFESLTVPELSPEKVLCILGPDNFLRQACAAVVANSAFDKVILVLISVSSVTLALDNPLQNPDSEFKLFLDRVDVGMTVLFTLEMSLKILACGFAFMPRAYLRNSWNVLDFVVVVISIASLYYSGTGASNLGGLKSLRALRALRPLR